MRGVEADVQREGEARNVEYTGLSKWCPVSGDNDYNYENMKVTIFRLAIVERRKRCWDTNEAI